MHIPILKQKSHIKGSEPQLIIRKKISVFFAYWYVLAHFSASICQAGSLMMKPDIRSK